MVWVSVWTIIPTLLHVVGLHWSRRLQRIQLGKVIFDFRSRWKHSFQIISMTSFCHTCFYSIGYKEGFDFGLKFCDKSKWYWHPQSYKKQKQSADYAAYCWMKEELSIIYFLLNACRSVVGNRLPRVMGGEWTWDVGWKWHFQCRDLEWGEVLLNVEASL
jgi:hypothetical protein